MKNQSWIPVLAILAFSGCNYTEGECYPRGQGAGNAGAGQSAGNAGVGGSIILPAGAGGFGDLPPDPQGADDPPDCNKPDEPDEAKDDSSCNGAGGGTPADGTTFAYCSDACAAKCATGGLHGFSSTLFKFATIVADDGTGAAGGWQVASADLKIVRWTSVVPESWTCPVTVGMPLRTTVNGTISPAYAATITPAIATQATHSLPNDLPLGIFCSKLKPTMQSLFIAQYPTIGASMM